MNYQPDSAMKRVIFFLNLTLAIFSMNSCKKEETPDPPGEEWGDSTSIVYQGKTYPIRFFDKWWMAENLAWLPSVSPDSVFSETKPYYYVYGYNGSNVMAAKATDSYKTYGVLYNWTAAMTACPPGWHLATDADWKSLESSLGMGNEELDKEGYRDNNEVGYYLKSTWGWITVAGETGNGINSIGFDIKPGGYYLPDWDKFNGEHYVAYYWTSTENAPRSWSREIDKWRTGVKRTSQYSRQSGMYVRCVKNE